MKQGLFSLSLLSATLLVAASAPALILSETGNRPVADRGWPDGAQALANLESRGGWWEGPPFGGGEWHFIYRGDNAAFTRALTTFSKIEAPALEVVLHDGPHEDQFIKTNADWAFMVWVPTNWAALYGNSNALVNPADPNLGKPLPAPRLDVYLGGGGVDWSKITVPINLRVKDERSRASNRDSDGLYKTSSSLSATEVRTEDGSTIRVGPKADVKILAAHVYSQNNANTDFQVGLDTSSYPPSDTNSSVALRIGDRWYACHGSGGRTGEPPTMFSFAIHNQAEAEVAAKSLFTECFLHSPPGYKLLVEFVPGKSSYTNGEAITATFRLKNLDDRVVRFQRGGSQRGPRDNQYGFCARRIGAGCPPGGEGVADTGDALNFGGLWTVQELKPGQTFEDHVDLRKWFTFDKPGTYEIRGSYSLAFFQRPDNEQSVMAWNEFWNDYATAGFSVEVK